MGKLSRDFTGNFSTSKCFVIMFCLHNAMKGQILKILSYNCQGLNMKEKRRDVLNYLHSKNINICCLQDTHYVEQEDIDKKINGGENAFLILLHPIREVLLFSLKIILNSKFIKLKKMRMATFLGWISA